MAVGNERISMQQFSEVTAGGESGMIAPDPDDPDIVYGGEVDRLDRRTEQTHSVDPTLSAPDELYRRTWTLPLVFSKRDPKVLYFGNQKVFRTDDGGQHWTHDQSGPEPRESRGSAQPRCQHGGQQRGTGPAPRRDLCDRALAAGRQAAVGRHRRRPGLAQQR